MIRINQVIFHCVAIPLFIFIAGSSINAGENSLLSTLAQKTCVCVQQKDLKNRNQKQRELQLGLCVLGSAKDHADQIKQELGIDINNANNTSYESLGRQVGVRMAAACPDVFAKYFDDTPATASGNVGELRGTFSRLDMKGDFVKLVMTDIEGRDHEFFWLTYFKNSELLLDTKKLKQKTMTISYREEEFFEHRVQRYVKFKVITGVTGLELSLK